MAVRRHVIHGLAFRAICVIVPCFVAVPPGGYLVEAQPANGLMGTPGPQNVSVTAGARSSIELSYDTGIR